MHLIKYSKMLIMKHHSWSTNEPHGINIVQYSVHGKLVFFTKYRVADKSLARPGQKQARKRIRDARDFNNIETRAVIKFFFLTARQGAEGNARHSDRNISLFPSLSG